MRAIVVFVLCAVVFGGSAAAFSAIPWWGDLLLAWALSIGAASMLLVVIVLGEAAECDVCGRTTLPPRRNGERYPVDR